MKYGLSLVAAVAAFSAVSAQPSRLGKRVNLGACDNPGISFGPGFDGRQADSFQPSDKTQFPHGSALNIGVITQFICDQLQTKCKAGQDAVTACAQGQLAAKKQNGQAAADVFNKALGVKSVVGSADSSVNGTATAVPGGVAAPSGVAVDPTSANGTVGAAASSGIAAAALAKEKAAKKKKAEAEKAEKLKAKKAKEAAAKKAKELAAKGKGAVVNKQQEADAAKDKLEAKKKAEIAKAKKKAEGKGKNKGKKAGVAAAGGKNGTEAVNATAAANTTADGAAVVKRTVPVM